MKTSFNITNPDKLIYKKENITKLDIIKYYAHVADKMLPFLKERLLSAIRCPRGADSPCFFKKHATNQDQNISTVLKNGELYFYIKNKEQLLYQVQMGTLEFHVGGGKITARSKPNIMVFDLDPAPNVSLKQLRQGVTDLKNVLDGLNLVSFLKTSGGKGYHIVVPFSSCSSWESFSQFAKNIALFLENKFPNKYTSNIKKSERSGKIFIDYLRNDKGSTCVCAYSLRARPNAPISMPILWEDLNNIKPNEITIQNFKTYLKKQDPWQDFFKVKQSIK